MKLALLMYVLGFLTFPTVCFLAMVTLNLYFKDNEEPRSFGPEESASGLRPGALPGVNDGVRR